MPTSSVVVPWNTLLCQRRRSEDYWSMPNDVTAENGRALDGRNHQNSGGFGQRGTEGKIHIRYARSDVQCAKVCLERSWLCNELRSSRLSWRSKFCRTYTRYVNTLSLISRCDQVDVEDMGGTPFQFYPSKLKCVLQQLLTIIKKWSSPAMSLIVNTFRTVWGGRICLLRFPRQSFGRNCGNSSKINLL